MLLEVVVVDRGMLSVVVLNLDVGVWRHFRVGLTEVLARVRNEGEGRREDRIVGEEVVVVVASWLVWDLAPGL